MFLVCELSSGGYSNLHHWQSTQNGIRHLHFYLEVKKKCELIEQHLLLQGVHIFEGLFLVELHTI